MRDLRNHEGLLLLTEFSFESRGRFPSRFECFFPRRRLELELFGRRGSTASAKYSCLIASAEVGRLRGSHIKHQVTKLLRATGHCGGRSIVSMEWGAICITFNESTQHRVYSWSYLRKREPQFLCQPSTVSPVSTSDSVAGLVVPITRRAHNLTYSPYLINLVATGKQWF